MLLVATVVLAFYAALGVWAHRHRSIDLWVLLGVTALVARQATYHRSYDDVLIVLVDVAPFRIARRADVPEGTRVLAGALLGVTIVVMLFLASWEFTTPLFDWLFAGGHTVVWLADLVFLLACSRRWRTSPAVGAA